MTMYDCLWRKRYPLKDEEFNSSQVINNTILSISTIKLKGSKGETI